MNPKEWIMAMLGRSSGSDDNPAHVALDAKQDQIAGSLARMKGVTRDDVLNEAYRRARLLQEHDSYRRR